MPQTPFSKIHEVSFREIGSSNFERFATSKDALFVDKTLFIEAIIKSPEVFLITRPRRWGKRLNMSMLQYFFGVPVKSTGEIDEEEKIKRQIIFTKLKIGKHPHILENYLGEFPVIFVSFKEIKADRFGMIEMKIKDLIYGLYEAHKYLLQSDKLDNIQKTLFNKFITKSFDLAELENSLSYLSKFLFAHFNQKVIILIDEYDTPMNDWYAKALAREDGTALEENKNFEEVVSLFRGMLSSALKGNDYLEKAVVTGILRIAKADLFSGLNNLGEDSVLDKRYAPYFGFTEEEVTDLLEKTDMNQTSQIFNQMKSWYNGYNVGDLTVYNPWSIMNCLYNKGELQAYWVGTASTALLERALVLDKFQGEIQSLVEGQAISMTADPKMVSADITLPSDALYNLLLFSGYLTAESARLASNGITYNCRVKIPNHEVKGVFLTSVTSWIERKFKTTSQEYYMFVDHLLRGDVRAFQEHLKSYLSVSGSYFDAGQNGEILYNGFMWGLFASSVNEDYFVEKERETGKVRADLVIIPKATSKYPVALILEYKIAQKEDNLKKASESALHQIEAKNYEDKLKSYPDVKKIIKIGMAFCWKDIEISFKE